MYCVNCGKLISDKGKFCPYCGERIFQPVSQTIPPHPRVVEKHDPKPFSRSYSHKSFGFTVFQIFLLIILIVFELVLVCNKDLGDMFRFAAFLSGKTSEINIIRVLLWILIAFNVVICIFKIVLVSVVSATHLTVNETGVYGCGGLNSIYSKAEFSLDYSNITHASTQSGNLIINTTSGKYICRIDNEHDAAMIINNTMREGNRNNSFHPSSVYRNSSEVWRCPSCGRVNQNYVGSCGCGCSKPKK